MPFRGHGADYRLERLDGIHFEADQHRKLGRRGRRVREILNELFVVAALAANSRDDNRYRFDCK